MNMHYEMFLIIQLVHLTCRKDHVQLPTRKKDETCSEEQVMIVQDSL